MDKKSQVLFVSNYKGGSSKTTTVFNLAEYFSSHGKSILLLDMDAQSALSERLLVNGGYGTLQAIPEEETLNYVFDLSIEKIQKYKSLHMKFSSSMIKTYKNKFDFMVSHNEYRENQGLCQLSERMKEDLNHLTILKNYLDEIRENYDYIFIDGGALNNRIAQSAFLLSDYYIIPAVMDGNSLSGVSAYIDRVHEIYRSYCEEGEDARLGKHIFGKKAALLGVFYTAFLPRIDYGQEYETLVNTLEVVYGQEISVVNEKVRREIDLEANMLSPIQREEFRRISKRLLKVLEEWN